MYYLLFLIAFSSIGPADYILQFDLPKIVSHRILSSIFPENTAQSFEGAMFQGTDFIKLDIILNKELEMCQLQETNSLVEEFILLANCSVANQILQRFPSVSVLRRHHEPKMKQLKGLQILMNDLGYQFTFDTSKLLSELLDQIQRPNDSYFNNLIRMITTRCMNDALYVCTADVDYPELYYYGLAAELYTHFTSLIRRYADVLVHRLLAASIDLESLPLSMNSIRMTRICDNLNIRHRMARFASRDSSDYHKTQQIDQAIITGILTDKVTVIILRYGLEGTIEVHIIDRMNITIQGTRHRIFDYTQVEVSVDLHLLLVKNFTIRIIYKIPQRISKQNTQQSFKSLSQHSQFQFDSHHFRQLKTLQDQESQLDLKSAKTLFDQQLTNLLNYSQNITFFLLINNYLNYNQINKNGNE